MMVFTVEVTWGERIGLAVERWERNRPGRNRTALFSAVAELTNVTRNSVSKYLSQLEPPRRLAEQQRVVILLLALGETPSDYGLSEDVLPRYFTAELLGDTLVSHNSTWNCATPDTLFAQVA